MADRLSLDTLQVAQVDSLLDSFRSSMNEYRRSLQASRDSLRTEIRALLSETQRLEYDKLIAEISKRDNYRRPDSLRTQ